MNTMTLKRFRMIGIIEGISYLVLLFIAMPLKYIAGIALAVKIVGMIHGLLFIGYVVLLALAMKEYGWSLKYGIKLFIASLIPFGTFFTEKELKRRENVIPIPKTNN